MTQRFSLPQVLLMLAAGFIVIGAPRPAAAEAGACKDLVGTYLTKNFAKGESSGSFTSRSLIALSGSWPGLVHRFRRRRRGGLRSVHRRTRLVALHRSEQDARDHLGLHHARGRRSRAQIGRLDFGLAYDASSKTIKGTATLRLIPLGDDRLIPGEIGSGRQFEIVGQRVEAQ